MHVRHPEAETLPPTVRYVKNGEGGAWWREAHARSTIELGWDEYPDDALLNRDVAALTAHHGSAQTQDLNRLLYFLEGKDYIWMTFEDGCLWWCTVSDVIEVSPGQSTATHGHFRLKCERPWSNYSLDGKLLAISDLPGTVTATTSFRATSCQPSAHEAIRRVIVGGKDPAVEKVETARDAFCEAVEALVAQLTPKDFELLVDLILARTGWVRIARLGGVTEGIDIEAQNAATGEIAFVQVKSAAGQGTLDHYVSLFNDRRERYARMIFAVHTTHGAELVPPPTLVHVWPRERIASLVADLGLAGWLGTRI